MTDPTPVPWKYIDATKEASMQYAKTCVIRNRDKQIATFSWNDKSPHFPTKEESQSNARLIVEAVNTYAQHKEVIRGLLEAAKEVDAWFEAIKQKQDDLLVRGQDFESASKNWGEATDIESFDFRKLKEAIQKAQELSK